METRKNAKFRVIIKNPKTKKHRVITIYKDEREI